ncbi:MAG: glutathione S-transferase family protein [Gammaproteobacteria bacterium]|nr:glutathione S-transferase family protein [Gammaproteobacteria bacterium]TVQ48945.1 MAG: glutathione S-transferase family protein [Gammaproteobacteria bacterium]
MKLYHCAGSRSVRVRWLLEELGVEYQLEELPFGPQALKSAEFRRVNPLGRVPALVDGELVMHESGAIVQYILETYAEGRLQPAIGTPERGEFLNWIHFAEASLMVPVGMLIGQLVFTPEDQRNAGMIAYGRQKYAEQMKLVDDSLADREWLLGEFSAADVMLGYTVFLTAFIKMLDESTPNVQAYFARVRARPAWQRAMTSTLPAAGEVGA